MFLPACYTKMPGQSFSGPLPALTASQAALSDQLRRDVATLATTIGPRNISHPAGLAGAANFLEQSLASAGYTVARQTHAVEGVPCSNLEVELPGSDPDLAREIVVVGAHYDSVHDCPAANDNGSGVAATLALARAIAGRPQARTIRFLCFVNEEPPTFWTKDMGSLVYARRCKDRAEQIVAMLSLETIGYYSDEPGSQSYPPPFSYFYPSTGNFIAFVGNSASVDLVRRCVGSFREHAQFPSEGAAVPGWIPRVGSSDHWSFWKQGYPVLMVTDTAPHRYKHYHMLTDTPDRLDYERMARVVEGLGQVIIDVAAGATR